jgi:hypothetical protein
MFFSAYYTVSDGKFLGSLLSIKFPETIPSGNLQALTNYGMKNSKRNENLSEKNVLPP